LFASIVTNRKAAELNRAFTYEIPEELLSDAIPGKRVVVPFGREKLEGIIVALSDTAPEGIKTRKIIEILDKEPVITQTGFELARFVIKRYFASLNDALRLNMPPGMTTLIDDRVYLSENTDITEFSGEKYEILKLVSKYSGAKLKDILEASGKKNIRKEIDFLAESGALEIKSDIRSGISDKTVTVVTVIDDKDAINGYIEKNASKKARVRVLKILTDNRSMVLSDLLLFSKTSRKTVEALEAEGLLELTETEVIRNPYKGRSFTPDLPKKLTAEQEKVVARLKEGISEDEHKVYLLKGVTGSGKTEVYLQIIEQVINSGRQAILLVPEISLTPQMAERFFRRFGEVVSVIHSGLSKNERCDQYKLIRRGEVKIVIGARSAIFAPLPDTGIIIVDEEHESSYQSESSPRYNGVEVALKRGETENIPVVLASATPSVSSYYKALSEEYELLLMNKRYNGVELPETEIVDMRKELKEGNFSPLSSRLVYEIKKRVEKNEQTILFLNRRGYSTFVNCRNCGFVAKCPDCDVSLTYHSLKNRLVCHHCGYERDNFTLCPECGSKYIRYFGTGTEKIEEEIRKAIPGISVIRMDADTTYRKFAHEKILKKFSDENISVLLGTQMITKGLDFKNVTLAAVLAADGGLFSDSYKSCERTFSQITQVLGRAGRGDIRGLGIIQTYSPDNYVIEAASEQDYEKFYETEIFLRKQMKFPPFCDIISFTGFSEKKEEAYKIAEKAYKILAAYKEAKELDDEELKFFKPTEAPLFRIKNKYRYKFTVKGDKSVDIVKLASGILKEIKTGLIAEIL